VHHVIGRLLHAATGFSGGGSLHGTRRRCILGECPRSLDFAAQYQQEPVAEDGNLIKWKWFTFYDRPPHREIKDKIIVSAKEPSSYSVCVILQVRGETVFVLDVFRERLEYPDLKRKVIEFASPMAERG
jgi:hypothetical protein